MSELTCCSNSHLRPIIQVLTCFWILASTAGCEHGSSASPESASAHTCSMGASGACVEIDGNQISLPYVQGCQGLSGRNKLLKIHAWEQTDTLRSTLVNLEVTGAGNRVDLRLSIENGRQFFATADNLTGYRPTAPALLAYTGKFLVINDANQSTGESVTGSVRIQC